MTPPARHVVLDYFKEQKNLIHAPQRVDTQVREAPVLSQKMPEVEGSTSGARGRVQFGHTDFQEIPPRDYIWVENEAQHDSPVDDKSQVYEGAHNYAQFPSQMAPMPQRTQANTPYSPKYAQLATRPQAHVTTPTYTTTEVPQGRPRVNLPPLPPGAEKDPMARGAYCYARLGLEPKISRAEKARLRERFGLYLDDETLFGMPPR